MADGNGTGPATDGNAGPLGPDSEGAKPVRLGPNLVGSPDWHELIGDLIKARQAMPPLVKDNTADTGKFKYQYADLASLLEKCLGPLRENGLTLIQAPDFNGDAFVLTTVIANAGGAWISNVFRIPCGGRDPQAVGSAETYARRYSLMALLAICGEDDDGAAAMPQKSDRQTANKATGNKMTSGTDLEKNPAKVKLGNLLKNEIKCPVKSGPELFDAVTAGKFQPSAMNDPATAKEILALFEETAKHIPYANWMADLAEVRNHCSGKELDDFAAAALPDQPF